MAFDIELVESFGGGLNFGVHPAYLKKDEWTWCNGFMARDGYAEVCVPIDISGQTAPLAGGYTAMGVIPNPFEEGGYIVPASNDTIGKLYKFTPMTGTEITASGGFAPAAKINATPSFAFFENRLLVSFGLFAPVGANQGVVQVVPTAAGLTPASFTRLDQVVGAQISGALSPCWLEVCRDHVIAAAVDRIGASSSARAAVRTVAWCDSLRPEWWDESMFTSSRVEEWSELPYGITGMARQDANTVLIFCPDRVISLTYTQQNPPFVRSMAIEDGGAVDGVIAQSVATASLVGARGGVAKTPLGVAFHGDDNLYLWSGQGPNPIGNPVRNYLREKVNQTSRILDPMWHGHWGLLMFPVAVGSTYEVFMFDPLTKAWSRQILGLGGELPVGHCYAPVSALSSATGKIGSRWGICLQDGNVVQENATLTTPYAAAFVDTKDFHFNDAGASNYIDRIMVDWEPLTNSTTDAINVYAAQRNHFSPSILGSLGAESQSLSWSLIGTLTGGQTELPTRLKAKFVRLRFEQQSGRVRIRGFALRRLKGGDRAS